MKQTTFTINHVNWQDAKKVLQFIRRRVFIEEQSVPEELEWDGLDNDCIHILVRDDNNEPLATARILNNGHIGRMAVLKPYRYQGIGSAMLDRLIEHCQDHKLKAHLDAQTAATGFYERKGFTIIGEMFMDAGIPHKHMEMMEGSMEPEQYILGEDNALISFDSRMENRELATNLIRQAGKQIKIWTVNLESPIYDNLQLTQSLSKLATKNHHTSIKILVNDSTAAVKAGHRLIELARQFSSSIHLHKIPEDIPEYNAALLLVDDSGYLYKQHGDSFQGQANFNDKLKVLELGKTFDAAWERSKPDTELRRLYI